MLFFFKAASFYLDLLNLFYALRFVLFWFPNINPYNSLLYPIILITNPLLVFVSNRLPRIFGFDFSFMFVNMGIAALSQFLKQL